MRSFFNLDKQNMPIMVENIAAEWPQESVIRTIGVPCFQWLQTESGSGEFWVESTRFQLEPGSAILIAPDVPHHYEPMRGETWIVRFITFRGDLVNELSAQMVNTEFIYFPAEETKKYERIHERIINGLENRSLVDEMELSTMAYRFILELTNFKRESFTQNYDEYEKYVKPAIDFMKVHYPENISNEDIANSVFISPQYLGKVFKQFTTLTVHEYLLNIRIAKAKITLASRKNLDIQMVAAINGFNEASYFSKMFKKSTGLTPMQYRKWHK